MNGCSVKTYSGVIMGNAKVPNRILNAAATGYDLSGGRKAGSVQLTAAVQKKAREYFLQYVEQVAEVLVAVALNEEEETKHRVAASKEVLDRGLGKSVSVHQMEIGTKPLDMLTDEDLENLPDAHIASAIATMEALINRANRADAIDVSPNENESADDAKGDEAE